MLISLFSLPCRLRLPTSSVNVQALKSPEWNGISTLFNNLDVHWFNVIESHMNASQFASSGPPRLTAKFSK